MTAAQQYAAADAPADDACRRAVALARSLARDAYQRELADQIEADYRRFDARRDGVVAALAADWERVGRAAETLRGLAERNGGG